MKRSLSVMERARAAKEVRNAGAGPGAEEEEGRDVVGEKGVEVSGEV